MRLPPRRSTAWRGGAAALALVAAGGCGAASSDAPPPPEASVAADAARSVAAQGTAAAPLRWSKADCTLPDSPPAPIGRTARALLDGFGPPLGDTRFVLGTGLVPPRMVLLNRLPLKGNARVTVREMRWVRAGCALTAWLTQRTAGGGDDGWRVVQTLRSSAAAEY